MPLRLHVRYQSVWLALVIAIFAVRASAQEAEYVRVAGAAQLVQQWSPDKHLYVMGQLPQTSETELRKLAAWLQGKHWYVVLVRSAAGQSYTDIQGGRHAGVQALDFAIGKGFALKEGFKAVTHPKTGEQDGAAFGLYLDDKHLFLRTSDAHDRRGLSGERNFAGDLNQWAQKAMRSQGPAGVVTAVKDTITNVDARLEAQVEREVGAGRSAVERSRTQFTGLQQRLVAFARTHPGAKSVVAAVDLDALQSRLKSSQAALDAKQFVKATQLADALRAQIDKALATFDVFERNHRDAQTALTATQQRIDDLGARSRAFAASHTGVAGDLARVDTAALAADLKAAQADLEVDPARAQQRAQKLEQHVAGIGDALARHEPSRSILKNAQARLTALEGRSGAAAVQQPMLQAKQFLADAVQAHAQGDSAYLRLIARAGPALDSAERAVAEAEAAATRQAAEAVRLAAQRRFVLLTIVLVCAGALSITALVLHMNARRYRSQAQKLLADWNQALGEKLEVLHANFEENYRTWIGDYLNRASGDTRRLVDEARSSRGWVAIVWALAQDRLKQVQALVEPGLLGQARGLFLAGDYQRALGFENEKVAFRPDDEELLRQLFGKTRTWEDRLLGSVRDYAPLEASFAELVAQLNAHTQKVLAAIKEIETCALGLTPKVEALEGDAAHLEAKQADIAPAAAGGLFQVPALFAALVPAARSACSAARTRGPSDPVGAYRTEAAQADRMLRDGEGLAELIVASGAETRPAIVRAAQHLEQQGIDRRWIDEELARLSGEADAIASAAVAEPVAPRTADLRTAIAGLGERSGRAEALAQERARILERIAKAHQEVAEARKEISERTGVAPDKLLSEQGWKVDNKLYHARNRADTAAGLLGQPDLDGAQAHLEEARRFGQQVSEVLEVSLQAARAYRGAVAALTTQAQQIAAQLPQHRSILDEIRAAYAPSVLALGAGDPSHPSANATLDDNLKETEQHLQQAAARMRDAEVAHNEGRVLATADLLNQTKAHHELAQHRLAEIKDKHKRLQETAAANRAQVDVLRTRAGTYARAINEDRRTMQPTLHSLAAATAALDTAAAAVAADKGDPFLAHAELEGAAAALEHVHGTMAANDRDIYQQTETSLDAAAKQLAPLTLLVDEATRDDVPDSKELKRAERESRRLSAELKSAQFKIGASHGDWIALGAEANRIGNEASRLVAVVKGEMEKAEAAVAQIEQADDRVVAAGSWTGAYGIRIPGAPGDEVLAKARALLAQGLYVEAQRQAEAARQMAQQAIASAEAAVNAERARLEREEEERRQREAAAAAAQASAWSLSSGTTSSDNSSSSWGGSIFDSGGGGGGGGFLDSGGGSSGFDGFSSSGGGSSDW